MAIIIKPPVSGGGGAVDSVNGQTGVVVLTTDNIDAGSNADRQYWTSSLQTSLDAKALDSDLTTLEGRVSTAESDIDTLQTDVGTLQTDILSIEGNTLYSNSYYVNDGVNDIQSVLDDIAGSGGANCIYLSAGSYGGSVVSISNHANINVLAPESPTGVHICELASRGMTISGASTTRIKIENLNIEGAFLIDGTQGRHLFKNCIFDSTVTITNATANFITFEQCSFAGAISIASSVTATVYFDRCALGNQFITSSRIGAASPLLTILTECSGLNSSQTNLTSNVALVGRTGLNSGVVTQYQNADSYVYDLNNGLSTSFSGSYTELRNKPSIPSNTDGLTEGSSNKYFTTTRARDSFSAGTGISITSGQISSSITQYTDADADARIALQKGANNGICELDANGLVPTNHLPPLAITDVHVVADEAARLALTAQEGDVAIQSDDSSSWIYDGSTWVQFGLSGGVLSVNGQTGTVSLDTDDITEGGSNFYYTNTRFDNQLATKTTDNLTEGSTHEYFTITKARNSFSAGTGITIVDGQISSSVSSYSDEQARDAAGSALASGVHTGISFVNNDALDRIDATISLAGFTSDNLNEGSTNKYATSTSVRPLLSATAPIVYTQATGVISTTLTQYTDELAQDASASLFTSGTHSGITYTYNDGSNSIDSSVSISGNALTWPTVALSAGTTAVVVGNYYYTSTTLQGSAHNLTPPSTGKNGDIIYVHNNAGNTINFGTTAYYFNGTYSGTGQTFSSTESDVFVFTRAGTGNAWFISKQVSQVRYTDALAKTASVVNSMAGSQTDQAPSVSSVKGYYTGGTGVTISSGSISVSLGGFSIDALSDVDTTTNTPTSGQALAWDGTSKWVPTTIAGSSSRIAITNKTTSFAITDPVSASVIEEHYTMDSTSATTFTLPTAVGNNGLTYNITRINTGAVTVATVSSQTISGLSSVSIPTQWGSLLVRSNGSGWIIC